MRWIHSSLLFTKSRSALFSLRRYSSTSVCKRLLSCCQIEDITAYIFIQTEDIIANIFSDPEKILEVLWTDLAMLNSTLYECFDLRCMSTTPWFSIIFTKGNNFCDFLFAFIDNAALSKYLIGSTLKGKNLLLWEQILFFKSWPLMRWEAEKNIKELLLLKVYPFTLKPSSVK